VTEGPLLEFRDVAIAYATRGGEVPVIPGLSFRMDAGEAMGLVGESGCGKSTVALSIVRYLGRAGRLVRGRILFEGRDLATLERLAEAVGTKCLAIYSTTPPALRIGHYRHVKALWRESLPCVPCFDRGCPAAPCMQVSPERVMRSIEDWNGLAKITLVDGSTCALPSAVAAESAIMESWPNQTDRRVSIPG